MMDSVIGNISWEEKKDYVSSYEPKVIIGKRFSKMQTLMKNAVIVRFVYESSLVNVETLDARTTFSDKIANLGGTYGIWAELTGCSLLGIIHLLIIIFKIMMQKFGK